MNGISNRPCNYPEDKEAIVALLLKYRAATTVYTYPTAWRLRLLLSSRVWDVAHDARIWEDVTGRIAAFAMLWSHQPTSPYRVFDRFIDPEWVTDALVKEMLAWGIGRAHELAAASNNPKTLYVRQLASSVHSDHQLEKCGFSPVKPDPDEYNVYFSRTLQDTLPEPMLPVGYGLRPLPSADELASYADLYDFTAVSLDHRQETFNSDEYGHLVVVDPTGLLVAYCEYSICRAEWRESGQRLGWIDYIGTRPENQRQGLGRAVLWASLRHLQALGAETAMLVTISTNFPAINLYETTGFTRMDVPEAPSYEKQVVAN